MTGRPRAVTHRRDENAPLQTTDNHAPTGVHEIRATATREVWHPNSAICDTPES
jgi:hypothetical protein